jgi:long-chain fatty acid transport protein
MVVGAGSALATNGDNLMGVGPVSRAMGGVGIALPQDSVTAIFQNPAALGACPCGSQSESIFGATLFDPTVTARITLPTPNGPYTMESKSAGQPNMIPAIGVTMSATEKIRFGVGAYGVSGMGVDYRNNGWDLDGKPENGYEGDIYTKLEVMKFAGMASYQALDNLALGISLNGTYNNLDFQQGSAADYSFGGQAGILLNLGSYVSVGATYRMAEKADHRKVYNFDQFMGDRMQDDLSLEAPQSIGLGIAVTPTEKIVVEFDIRNLDWSSAEGYDDFDWDSQWVFALGGQLQTTEKLTLRCGYNFAKSPVNEHNGWNPMGVSKVQGKSVPTFGYEMLRVIGFPAVAESHATIGASYKVTDDFSVHLAYMHAFENTISETSAGGPYAITLESDLEEDSYSFSLAWAF